MQISPSAPVTVYLSADPSLRGVLTALREILLDCGLQETYRWRQPCYMVHRRNVALLGRVGREATVAFFQGALLEDAAGLLRQPGPDSRAVRQLSFTRVDQVAELSDLIGDYVRAAIALEQAGQDAGSTPDRKLAAPPELVRRFSEDDALRVAFASLTPGRQRGYLIYFTDARQSTTRSRRIDRCAERILAGSGLHDCTCGHSQTMPRCDGSHKQFL